MSFIDIMKQDNRKWKTRDLGF